VQYYRYAKTEIWAQERERQKSDHARDRHEFRLERLEREKQEREERMRKKKAALNKKDNKAGDIDPKKKAIQEALERVKQRKQQGADEKKNIQDLTPEQQEKIRAVDERRRQQNEQQSNHTKPATQDD
jgi:electron transport complex protein RnfC